jgi:hypothetical protein
MNRIPTPMRTIPMILDKSISSFKKRIDATIMLA